jgi:hypothetical protein
MNSSARRPGAAASSLAAARISSSVASEQVGLLGGERRAVAVHQPLAGAGVLQAKVGQQRYYFGSRGHGGVLSVGAVAGGGGCRWCRFWQSARAQYNDPAVNRHRWWTWPHSGQTTGTPDRSPG